ncbi:MAG TPA: DUF2752 domain-containing protein [Blastocatellia bacterium]|nr:DUF2752 domain-containing protein [Blastocatellia bacterium]
MGLLFSKLNSYRDRLSQYSHTEKGSQVFIFTLLSAVFLTSFLYNAPDVPHFTVCIFKNLTGLDCPGCGLTRSFCALSRGNIAKAFYFNKLGPFLYVVFVFAWLRALFTILRFDRVASACGQVIMRSQLGRIGLAAFVVYWIARTALHFAGYQF